MSRIDLLAVRAYVLVLLTALLLTAVAGCSASESTSPELHSSVLTSASAALPDVSSLSSPAELLAAHAVSTLQPYTHLGSDAYAQSGAAAVLGTGMELPSATGEIQWAIYHHVGDGSQLVSLSVDYGTATGNEVWIAVANFSSLSWVFFGPYQPSQTVLDLSTAAYQSATKDLFFAVISYNGTFITVNESTITYDDQTVSITYTADVAPFLADKCTSCHEAGNALGGVLLDTYAEAVANAVTSNATIQDGSMPPFGTLTTEQKAMFQAWVDAGTPE